MAQVGHPLAYQPHDPLMCQQQGFNYLLKSIYSNNAVLALFVLNLTDIYYQGKKLYDNFHVNDPYMIGVNCSLGTYLPQ